MVPWQVLVGGGASPDIARMLTRTAMPLTQRAARRSLRRPGVAMALVAILGLVVEMVMGSFGVPAAIRLAMSLSAAAMALGTGSKAGGLRKLTLLLSVGTAGVQLFFAATSLRTGLDSADSVMDWLPGIVAMLAAVLMAARLARGALR